MLSPLRYFVVCAFFFYFLVYFDGEGDDFNNDSDIKFIYFDGEGNDCNNDGDDEHDYDILMMCLL